MPESLPHDPLTTSRRHSLLEALTARGIDSDQSQRILVEILEGFIDSQATDGRQGVYIYGPPGRGKTLITNAFVALQPASTTRRFHFHEFFRMLNSPTHHVAGQPMGAIFSQGLERELHGVDLLVFDEFHCTEPGDAMLMGKLVKYCSEHNVRLITTSNYGPEKLLDDDTFHHLVKPTIEHIRQNFEVFELDNAQDYRFLDELSAADRTGFRSGSLTRLPQEFPDSNQSVLIEIGYDRIEADALTEDTVWISFDQMCRTRRNTADYLELASRYSRWHITKIPSSSTMPMDEERRLANLIDVFYDKDIEVHLHAEDDLSELGHMLHDTEKARLTSRLAQLERRETERTNASS
ncbi:cell division protein ZapE [Glutamicibacter sp. JC586]|uniref:cell division protein ZapE n=1 Tax=Glutamicibacter sp. JC586 TaxID=2590552 RepID=UPI00135C02D1|nr:cell division protein ZapE [Glutamicibacter sp. JC586]